MNYTELCTHVQDMVEDTFTADQLATFARQCEQRVYNMVQLPALRKNVTGTMTSGNAYLACPTDFLSVHSIAVIAPSTGAYTFLTNKDVSYLREAYPTPTSTGTPKYYAIFGPTATDETELTLLLAPTPDASYSTELHYYFYPESIVTATNTWLGDNYDPVLVYGMLVEAYTFMKGENDLLQVYNTKFGEALTQLKRIGDGQQKSDSFRSGQARVPVN